MRTWLMGTIAGVLCVAASSAMTVATAAAGPQPVGLVLSYTGSLPTLAPYTEITVGSEFNLGADTISFVHYGTCKTVEVKGGKLKIGADNFQADGVTRELEKDQCPEQVPIKTAGVSGGVLMRAISLPEIPPRLDCVLAGSKHKSFSSLQILDGSTVLGQIPLKGAKMTLPASMQPLKDGRTYKLNLVPGNSKEQSRVVTVLVSTPTNGKLCLLRID